MWCFGTEVGSDVRDRHFCVCVCVCVRVEVGRQAGKLVSRLVEGR